MLDMTLQVPATVRAFSASALPWLDMLGIALFATSGALAAARARLTLVTFGFFAAITGTGGGTIRDLLIGAPVFWMRDPFMLGICLAMALLVWITPQRLWPEKALDWFDAAGLAAYAVFGAAKALAWGVPVVPAWGMGIVTACAGGILRDVLAGVPSILIRPELYITAAALAGFALRGVAIARGLALPPYRGGPD